MEATLAALPGGPFVAEFLSRPRKLLIGSTWVEAQSGRNFAIENPATGRAIAQAAAGGAADVDRAVRAARKAFEGPWSRMLPAERGNLIWKLGDAIEAHADELALLETLDTGKPLKIARDRDVARSADRMRYYAGWATKLTGETLSSMGPENWHGFTVREPVGVVGLITPWNLPILLATLKIGPALAAGCTIVLKPAEMTSLTALRLGELAQEVGLPEGVLNVVTGFGAEAGAALAAHPDVDKVSFTGSTETGKAVLRASTGNLKRLTLELGGKSPVFVFADADLDRAIPAVANGIFANAGQVCSAGSRLYAHRSVFDRVLEGIEADARKLRVGPGLDPASQLGPVISEKQLERVTGYIASGRKDGAGVAVGGRRIGNEGYFIEPTVLTGTTAGMAVRREEIFGPVLCAVPFDTDSLDELAQEANDTIYGLAGYVWTRDLSTAHRLARMMKAGLININGAHRDDTVPSGGFKQSGWGRESGRAGIEAYTELKSVLVGV